MGVARGRGKGGVAVGRGQKRCVARGRGGWTPNYIGRVVYQNIRNGKSKPVVWVSVVLVDGCGQGGVEKGVWQWWRGITKILFSCSISKNWK